MDETPFDYIVVGAGSAGCAVAERLTRDGRTRVLLIEAGGSDKRFWIKVPLGYGVNFANPRLNWSYHAEPDAGLNGRAIYWPRGRVIGGSSSINAMAYMRGLPHDFDDWESAGARDWSWQDVRPAYEQLERHFERDTDGTPRQRGDGPLAISDLSDQMNPFSERFLTAAAQNGWARSENLSAATDQAVGYYRSTVRRGVRWSSADAFLAPARGRGNLRVVSGALVEKVILQGRRAIGVRFRHKGRVQEVRAGREVILSAGAINSPKLLQLSGIGPAVQLRTLGIAPLHDLREVGRGLQDHLAISYLYRSNVPTLNNILGCMSGRMMAGLRYLATRRGPLAVPVNQVGGYIRSDPALARPDMQIYCNPMSYGTDAAGRTHLDPAPGYLLCAQPCRPDSRGEVLLRSSDPEDAPLIRPNSLATEHDRDAARRALRLIAQMARAPALAEVTRQRLTPAPELTDLDALLEDFRARASTVFHPTSTCRMGHGPQDSVLDHRLRVHGISGLRVVDASAFPNVTSGNTNAPTIMLASRAAGMIVEDSANAPDRALAQVG